MATEVLKNTGISCCSYTGRDNDNTGIPGTYEYAKCD